jgi:hypothetical protein
LRYQALERNYKVTTNYIDNRPFTDAGDCPHCRITKEEKHLHGICRYDVPRTLAVAINVASGVKRDVTDSFNTYVDDMRGALNLTPDEDFVLITCGDWHEYWKARVTLARTDVHALYARSDFESNWEFHRTLAQVESRCAHTFVNLLVPGWGHMPAGDPRLVEEVASLIRRGSGGLTDYTWEHVKDVLADIKLELSPALSVDNVTGLEPSIGGR